MTNQIPNALTALNLVLGFFSIIATLQGDFFRAGVLIILAMVADGLDGRAARYFKVSSEFGKELDSLCDAASFGVAPGILAYAYLLKEAGWIGAAAGAMFATCAALRLARFNVNVSTVKGYFMGLPSPAGGCLVATFVMTGFKPHPMVFAVMVFVFGWLMVSSVRYPDFKGKGEKIRPIPAIVAGAASAYLLVLSPTALPFALFFGYTLFGVMNSIMALFDQTAAS